MRAQAHSDGRPDHGTVRLLHAHAFSLSLSLSLSRGREVDDGHGESAPPGAQASQCAAVESIGNESLHCTAPPTAQRKLGHRAAFAINRAVQYYNSSLLMATYVLGALDTGGGSLGAGPLPS